MSFVIGFLVWLAFGAAAGTLIHAVYRGPGTMRALSYFFGVMGAFIGGMLGMSPYIFQATEPTRIGGIIGALAGAVFFVYLYHFTARKVV